MESFWRSVGITLGRRWKLVLAVMVVITAVLGIGLTRVEFATGEASYLNQSSQVAIDNVEYQNNFGGEAVIILFTASEGSDADVADLVSPENLPELARLETELRQVDNVASVITPLTALCFSDALLQAPDPVPPECDLSPPDTVEPLESAAGQAALIGASTRDEAGAAARNADIALSFARLGAVDDKTLGNPPWNDVLMYDNTGFQQVDGALVAPADEERAIRLSLRGSFPDQQTAVGGIVLGGNLDLDAQSAATADVLDVLESANVAGFDVVVTGSPVYLKEINDYLKGGTLTLGLAAMVVMAIVLGVMFKVRRRLIPLVAVVFGVVWTFSILGLIGIDLSLVTISGLPILIGLGIDFAIQIHNRYEEEVNLDHDTHPMSETAANLAPPLFAATLAGVVAFLALRLSKVPMIRDFGVMLAIGIVVLATLGIVVPGVLLAFGRTAHAADAPTGGKADAPTGGQADAPDAASQPAMPNTGATAATHHEPTHNWVERVVVKLGGLPTRWGLALVVLSLFLFVGGLLVEGRTKIESDPIKWIDQGSQVVTDIEFLEERTGFATTLGVLVNANNVYDQDVIDLMHDFTLYAEARPDVAVSSSLVGTMAKIIAIPDATPIAPTEEDIVEAAKAMPPDVRDALVNDDQTAAQINLRLAPASLEERSVTVAELEAELDSLIAALDVPADSILMTDLSEGQDPVRATPAGLAMVGIGLLENLSANRAALTYLALSVAGLYLVLRLRSFSRALLALVPVFLAVGLSSLIVGVLGISLSPLTTVSGPLIIASCTEFSVLILGRYLEERQRGLDARFASDKAAARTGLAFFTSACTTIGGFAVLMVSPLPLLRDFGIIVTLNVAIALLAALIVMPPMMVWVDLKGWLGTESQVGKHGAVKLAADFPHDQTALAGVGVLVFAGATVGVYVAADTSSGSASALSYAPVALPTTTTTTTTLPPTTTTVPPTTVPGQEPPESTVSTAPSGPVVDPSGFPTEPPVGPISAILFSVLIAQGVEPNVANCAISTALLTADENQLVALGIAEGSPEALAIVIQGGLDCGIPQETIDAAIAAQFG
jgi:predicted RND superfamily exporter protein